MSKRLVLNDGQRWLDESLYGGPKIASAASSTLFLHSLARSSSGGFLASGGSWEDFSTRKIKKVDTGNFSSMGSRLTKTTT